MNNKNKLFLTICIILSVAIVGVALFMFTTADNKDNNGETQPSRTDVAPEYKYNTKIEISDNAPDEKDPEIKSISGYTEDNTKSLLKLPLSFDTKYGDSNVNILDIISIGKYSGEFEAEDGVKQVTDVLAIVVKNPSDKALSIASLTVTYDDNKQCSFSPSNIPAKQSAIIMTNNDTVSYKDVKKFDCTLDYAVAQDELPLIKDKVGVDFKDGQCVITNLTSENLGDVYVRFKKYTNGNVYLGSKTYSVYAQNVQPYETYTVDAPEYSDDNCVIIAVENHIGS